MQPDDERGYEEADVRTGPLVLATLVLTGVVVVVSFGVLGLFRGLEQRAGRLDLAEHARVHELVVPGPQLQADPALELREHRALEASRTGEYGWVDREAGVVRIPVERAMELLIERGLPAREGAPRWDASGEAQGGGR
jgi:hypothetical protein